MEDTVTLRIPSEMKDALEKICKAEGTSMSVMVRDALKKLIALYQFETLRKEIMPFAEKEGLYTDEDVLDTPS